MWQRRGGGRGATFTSLAPLCRSLGNYNLRGQLPESIGSLTGLVSLCAPRWPGSGARDAKPC